jgi:hypothetical protein
VVDDVGSSQRLDGAEWGEPTFSAEDEIEETYELYATPSVPGVLELEVRALCAVLRSACSSLRCLCRSARCCLLLRKASLWEPG